jgi:tetratricopeptide (TPR) repeat protein/4-amino-4-deoxy-L-arabinose transferase-like glycosyltransferase
MPDCENGRRFSWRRAALLGLAALALRIAYTWESASSPFFDAPVIDARSYVEDALELAGGSWAGQQGPFWQPPLYPYFLGLVFWLVGEDYWLPRLVQALLGAAACVFLYLVGQRLLPQAVALGAGWAAALYGPLIYFGGELLPTIPAIFLQLLFFVSLRPPMGAWRWLLSGLLLGLAALAVANVLLFVPCLLLWLLWQSRNGADAWFLRPAALLLGCALAIAPVAVRNRVMGGEWVLISHNAGINFYLGNNPQYERTLEIRPGRDWAVLVETPEREAGIEGPGAKSRYFLAKAWDFMASDPLGYARLLAYKVYLFWHGNELRRNLDPYWARNDSLVLRLLLWKHGLAFPFGLIAPLALLGLFCFWRSPAGQTQQGQVLMLFLLAYMASVVLFFISSRHRLPAVPFALLFAAYGFQQVLGPGARRKVLLALLAGLVLATNLGAGPMNAEGDAHQHCALGVAYEHKGMRANAMREYRKTLEQMPDHREARLHLAALHEARREYAEAIVHYRALLDFQPEALPVRFLLGNAYLAAQRYGEAMDQYESLVHVRPQWGELFGRLAYACLMAGQPGRAIWAYRRTLEIRPDSSLARYQLARLYEAQDSLEAAVAEYLVLVEREPDDPQFRGRLADLLVKQEEAGQQTFPLERNRRLQEAENHLRQAVHLDPDLAATRWSLGMLLAKEGRYGEAIEHFERLLELEEEKHQVHFCLANLYRRTGREEEAQQHMAHYARASREKQVQQQVQREAEKQIEKMFGRAKAGQGELF